MPALLWFREVTVAEAFLNANLDEPSVFGISLTWLCCPYDMVGIPWGVPTVLNIQVGLIPTHV